MSPSVLYERLGELADARLIERAGDQRYQLTGIGRELGAALDPLDRWARRWADQV
jgi:DNA-binding HxlR family transcriptional regulator